MRSPRRTNCSKPPEGFQGSPYNQLAFLPHPALFARHRSGLPFATPVLSIGSIPVGFSLLHADYPTPLCSIGHNASGRIHRCTVMNSAGSARSVLKPLIG
jgi:hypothetical protein